MLKRLFPLLNYLGWSGIARSENVGLLLRKEFAGENSEKLVSLDGGFRSSQRWLILLSTKIFCVVT